jgi:hypothetical protein
MSASHFLQSTIVGNKVEPDARYQVPEPIQPQRRHLAVVAEHQKGDWRAGIF